MAELTPQLARARNTMREIAGNTASFVVVTTMIALTLPEIAIEAITREKNMVQKHGGRALGFATLAYLGELYAKVPDEKPLTPKERYKERDSMMREYARLMQSPNFKLPGDDMIG